MMTLIYHLSTFKAKKRAVGNGVPLSIGRALARAVKSVTVQDNFNAAESQLNINDQGASQIKYCLCGCGRVVMSSCAKYYDFSCRKRKQRNKDKLVKAN
jgi:DNA (cytosine-5)-methyltransferase 1